MKRVLWLVELMAGPRSTDEWERRRHRAIVFAIVSILLAVLVTTVLVVAFDRAGVGGAREDYGTEEGVSRPRPDLDDVARPEALRKELRRLRAEVLGLQEEKQDLERRDRASRQHSVRVLCAGALGDVQRSLAFRLARSLTSRSH